MSDSIDLSPMFEQLHRMHMDRHWEAHNRHIFTDERTCSNCAHHDECWVTTQMPDGFELRDGWDENRLNSHMRSIVGQICNRFTPNRADMRERLARSEQRRRIRMQREQRTSENGWDLEENEI